MHRFRKKSDTKRSQVPSFLRTQPPEANEILPELPPASDFRTSLILPDLSRRFTLLRTSSGDPVSLDDLRSRFAEQRARGAENQISEEEEDMILETLGRIRAKNTTAAERSDENVAEPDYLPSVGRESVRSTETVASSFSPGSLTSSPSGRSTKRYSNNLFGSGRFRDYTYMRSVSSQQTKHGSTRSALSIAPTESSLSFRENASSYSDSLRPVTPDGSVPSSSTQSSPNEKISGVRSAPLILSAPYGETTLSAAEYRISKTLGPSVLKRASLALEEAIKEIEEEGEDEIVMPRSAPIARAVVADPTSHSADPRQSEFERTSGLFEAGMAISSDKQVRTEPENHRVSPIPFRIVPGYIPGMPRPMTPRDNLDSDDQRSHSTTPRATSPILPGLMDSSPSPLVSPSLVSGIFRRESNSSPSRQSPRPISPPILSSSFLSRTSNGRFTPEDNQRNGDSFSIDFDKPANSSILGRRRPASPLSGPAYQPMAVSSRPGTPSNVTWTTSPNSNSQKPSGHNRNGSWLSDGGFSSDMHVSADRSKSPLLPPQSPTLPDSPVMDRGHTNMSVSGSIPPNGLTLSENRTSSSVSGDLGSPVLVASRAPRSPTPTQNTSRSPTSPTFSNYDMSSRNGSRRSSKQNAPSSPFSLGPLHPLVFSPIANSSRSSLESAGSSYHSWDGDRQKDRGPSLFSDLDTQQSVWHDVSPSTDKSSSVTPGGSQDDGWDAEDIIGRYAGLRKSDFLAIQEKLVGVAIAKNAAPDIRDRAPSLRRRRPSTSQSNYSLNGRENRIASPPPQTQPPASPVTATPNSDQYSKASALLNSVVDSIQSPRNQATSVSSTVGTTADSQADKDVSPTTRRNRDLAQVLFGEQETEREVIPAKLTLPVSSETTNLNPAHSVGSLFYSSSPSPREGTDSPFSTPSPYQQTRNPSTPKLPQTPEAQAELAREVQRKTDAAMLALRKRPSHSNFTDGVNLLASSSISRRRISPNQISTPRLVSASTSVDTIPLRSPSVGSGHHQGPSKIGQRFKKFRGTLRAKPPVSTGEEVTPYPLDLHSPPATQTARYNPSKLNVPGGPVAASATDTGRFKVPVPSPPASAGPGLKGFMARFRGKQRLAETPPESDHRGSSQLSLATPNHTPALQHEQPLPQQRPGFHAIDENTPDIASSSSPGTHASPSAGGTGAQANSNSGISDADESVALKQLFDAASIFGLDQQALNDLLRSASTSSRSKDWTSLTRNNSTTDSPRPDVHSGNLIDRAQAPSDNRPSMDNQSARDEPMARKSSLRKQVDHARRPREGQGDNAALNAVVRRTIIFPSEARSSTIDLNVLMRKNSSRRRRASATSISSRSVHDRAPTPPPPRSPTTRRFSTDTSPPVPQLPPSFSSQGENLLHAPQSANAGGPIEKSSSTYDSLYEMYAGESRGASSTTNDVANGSDHLLGSQGDAPANSESGPALEVIELANGETIWSIVNGLRDDDAESVYQSRASFASEYSTRETNGEGVQIFFKEHGRTTSKSSNSSFLSRKKSQGKARPETKVFYSSSAQIGRLIENLSQGMEAGSFNFLPNGPPGHSTSSSLSEADMHWTVEERLEHMLGSMGTA